MVQSGLSCADVPLRNYSLTGYWNMKGVLRKVAQMNKEIDTGELLIQVNFPSPLKSLLAVGNVCEGHLQPVGGVCEIPGVKDDWTSIGVSM